MKLTSSYTCSELIYKDHNDVLESAAFKNSKKKLNYQDRSSTSSSSSSSSSYSNNSMTSEFCLTSPNSSGSSNTSNDINSTEKICADLNSLDLKNNSADKLSQEQKQQLKEKNAPGDSFQTQTTPYTSLGANEASSYLKLYKIQEKIRSGGFGVVFKGQRRIDKLPIAVKFISKEKISLWFDVSGINYFNLNAY